MGVKEAIIILKHSLAYADKQIRYKGTHRNRKRDYWVGYSDGLKHMEYILEEECPEELREKPRKISFGVTYLGDKPHLDEEFKPKFKEPMPYSIKISEEQSCYVDVEARSAEEAKARVLKLLETEGVYLEDIIFGADARVIDVDLDTVAEEEDYIDPEDYMTDKANEYWAKEEENERD